MNYTDSVSASSLISQKNFILTIMILDINITYLATTKIIPCKIIKISPFKKKDLMPNIARHVSVKINPLKN